MNKKKPSEANKYFICFGKIKQRYDGPCLPPTPSSATLTTPLVTWPRGQVKWTGGVKGGGATQSSVMVGDGLGWSGTVGDGWGWSGTA